MARCFRYLHHEQNEPLLHRDLKPDNVLMGDDLAPKVADFGESRKFDEEEAKERQELQGDEGGMYTMTMVGTPMCV